MRPPSHPARVWIASIALISCLAAARPASAQSPVVTAPSVVTRPEGCLIEFTVTVTSPAGTTITSLTASPLPSGSTFTPNADNTSGLFHWQTGFASGGSYQVTFSATNSNGLTGTATTSISVTASARGPVVSAPPSASVDEGSCLTIIVTAVDPDGDPINCFTPSPIPFGATFTVGASSASATFMWCPSFSQAGNYTVTFTACSDICGGSACTICASATTVITVINVDRPPVVTAPPTASGNEGSTITFGVTATDPDGDPITSLAASGTAIDAGGTFMSNAAHTSGTFTWTPSFTQGGSSYTAIFTATNALSGSATTNITVNNLDPGPFVTAPAAVSGPEGTLITFTVSVADPSGNPITSLTAAPLPAGATLTVGSGNTSGTFRWTPTLSQAGVYSVTFTATSGTPPVSRSSTTNITVFDVHPNPVLDQPADMTVAEGQTADQVLTATSADGSPLTFSKVVGPVFMTVATTSPTTGLVHLAPGFADAGTYTATVRATDGSALSDTKSFTIAVTQGCAPPTASTGGPYSGFLSVPICFDGTGSTDPNGTITSYTWDFGDGSTGTGPMPCHTYTVDGSYMVTLTIVGSCGSDTDVTTVSFLGFCANAFTRGGSKTLRLNSGKPTYCVQIEPVGGCYASSDVILSSIVMRFTGGAVSEIHALPSKTAVGGDANGNGIEEITACFAKEDLRRLFSGLPPGENDVSVTLAAGLATGGTVQAMLPIRVFASGASLAASMSPNPLNPEAVLTFTTSRSGFVRVTIHDTSGRLVRALMDEGSFPAGFHSARFDGRDSRGAALASGIYFYRVDAAEGAAFGRFAILK